MDPDKTPETHIEEDTEEDTEEDIPDTGMDRVRVSVTIGNSKKARFSAVSVYSPSIHETMLSVWG